MPILALALTLTQYGLRLMGRRLDEMVFLDDALPSHDSILGLVHLLVQSIADFLNYTHDYD